jgi:uncharacterized protein YdaU (DUF1376 family)
MSGKADHFMPFYVGDYLADTSHLSCEEHGAYLLLLFAAWKRGGRLPNDPVQLARIAACPQRRWMKVWGIIAHFFHVEGDQLVQHRVVREVEKARQIQGASVRGGLASAESRRAKMGSAQPGFQLKLSESLDANRRQLEGGSEHPQPQPDPDSDPPGGSEGKRRQDEPKATQGETLVKPGSAAPASPGAATTPSERWSGGRWLERFRAAFWEAKGRQYGRGETDSRAARDLTDRLEEIGDAPRAALEASAAKVFSVYFAMNGSVAAASHPFKWFAERSNEWVDWVAGRVTGSAPARAVGYAVVKSGKDWDAGMDRLRKR